MKKLITAGLMTGVALFAVPTAPATANAVDASVTTTAGAKRGHDGHRKPDLLT